MLGFLYIDNDKIGETEFEIIDESMGGIGGRLIPYASYEKYRKQIQSLYNLKGIANIDDLNIKILIENTIINPVGGIGITDSPEFDEILVESAGIDYDIIDKIR